MASFRPHEVTVSIRSLQKRRPDIYQLLLPELEGKSPAQPLPEKFPAKYFGEVFQRFLSSFSVKIPLKDYDGMKKMTYIHFVVTYNSFDRTVSICGSELQDVVFALDTGVHSVYLGFFGYSLEKSIGAMIRLIIALQKHLELSK